MMGAIGVLPTSSSIGALFVISVARYPYSPKLTIEECLDADEDFRDRSIEILCTSSKFTDSLREEDEAFLDSTDSFLSLLPGDKVSEGFLDPDIRLAPCSTIDILLSATNDGRLSSGMATGRTGAADSRRGD